MPAITFYLCLDERRFIEVLAFFFVLVHPQIGKHFSDVFRHEPRKDSVASILSGCRENAHIHVVLNIKHVA